MRIGNMFFHAITKIKYIWIYTGAYCEIDTAPGRSHIRQEKNCGQKMGHIRKYHHIDTLSMAPANYSEQATQHIPKHHSQ